MGNRLTDPPCPFSSAALRVKFTLLIRKYPNDFHQMCIFYFSHYVTLLLNHPQTKMPTVVEVTDADRTLFSFNSSFNQQVIIRLIICI